MILSELLGASVTAAGHTIGHLIDVRLVPDNTTDQPMPRLRVHGILVSPHSRSSTLGYERSGLRSPWPIAAFVQWRHRDSFLILWPDIQTIHQRTVELRPDHHRYSPTLILSAIHGPEFQDRQH